MPGILDPYANSRFEIRATVSCVRRWDLLAKIYPEDAEALAGMSKDGRIVVGMLWHLRHNHHWQVFKESPKSRARRREEVLCLKAALLPSKVEIETGAGSGVFAPFTGAKP